MPLTNAQLSELLARASGDEVTGSNREKALKRAGRSAFFWQHEAWTVVEADRPLTELTNVGPWLAGVLGEWLTSDDPPEPPEPPPLRSGFLTCAEVRETLDAEPAWRAEVRGDLQMHTTFSDGKAPIDDMVRGAAAFGYEFVGITDHSKTLPIANGMDEARLAVEGMEIDRINRELEAEGAGLRVLKSIEMDITPEGKEDMDLDALARLDLVLGAFHSKLRLKEDQTERYRRAIANPAFHILAHPKCRMFDRRIGLEADWPKVFEAAAEAGKAVEIDAHPNRQDLSVELLEVAREVPGLVFSMGTDAHSVAELAGLDFGLAAAARANIPRERILSFWSREDVLAWAASHPVQG